MNNEDCEITFLGDVYLPRAYDLKIELPNYIFNLEFPITDHDVGVAGKVNLRIQDNFIKSTFNKWPAAVCISNNHINDYGDQGFIDTISELSTCKVPFFGAGNEKDNYNNPKCITVGKYKIGLLGYTCASTSPASCESAKYCVPLIDLDRISEDIKKAKDLDCKKIIVSLHWGAEQITKPKPDDVVIARAIIDFGADLIIGHHAHCIQDYEIYKQKYIFYGMGNCIFPDLITNSMYDPETNKPKKQHVIKSKYWNKTSLAVHFDILNNEITMEVLMFDGKCLKHKPFWVPGKVRRFNKESNYDAVFKRYFQLGKFRYALFSWLQSPKMIRLRHLKGILSIFNRKVYK